MRSWETGIIHSCILTLISYTCASTEYECECERSPRHEMSRGMIHNKHRRMDHRLSVPLSTQPLGLYAEPGDICELIFCTGTLWDEQRRGTAHKFYR